MEFKNILKPKSKDLDLSVEKAGKGDSNRRRKLLIMWVCIFLLLLYIIHGSWIVYSLSIRSKGGIVATLNKVELGEIMLFSLNPLYYFLPLKLHGVAFLGSLGLTVALSMKIDYEGKQVAYGQKGDSRLTTQKELEQQFVAIPDKEKSFSGYGGIPISHYRKNYYIDTATNHTLAIGTSRSGKGQTLVNILIDILSRADKRSSMIVNDPKRELFAMAYDKLKERGYNVYLFNMDDPSSSMAYNPLQLVIERWLKNDKETAIQLVNSISYTLCHEENEGSNGWVYRGAQSAINGMIIALIDYCMNPKNFTDHKPHPEKVTMNNIIHMTNELMIQYAPDPDNQFNMTLLLDEFFKTLPEDSFAKVEYSSMASSESKGKASITSTILDRLSMFMMPKMAKMTSLNSLKLKSIGFPKSVSFSVGKDLEKKHLFLRFYFAQKIHDSNGKEKISYKPKFDQQFVMGVKSGGFVDYNFDLKLHTGDKIEIAYLDPKTNKERSSSWIMTLPSEKQHSRVEDNYAKLKNHKLDLGVEKLQLYYDEKPTVIFLNLPDYDPSNNKLASIFISQLYSELARECSNVRGGKTPIRVTFILDEAGNIEAINNFASIMTVSAGRNILFDLFFQSFKQIETTYGKAAATIKENCQNQILIKTTDYNTVDEFSKMAGNYTVEGGNVTKDKMNITKNYSASADSLRLLTVERLSQMVQGEDLVLRPLATRDLKGNLVRPYPIFNKGDYAMPFAYKLLANTFDPNQDPNLIEVDTPHENLNLSDLSVNWEDFTLFDVEAHKAFLKHSNSENKKRESSESSSAESESSASNSLTEEEIKTRQVEEKLKKSLFMQKITELYKTNKISRDIYDKFKEGVVKHDSGLINGTLSALERSTANKLKIMWEKENES